jgi:hypothetical protein
LLLQLIEYYYYFFEKNDMMLPCPAFFPFDPVELRAGFFFGGAAGSSSEKDSQTGSSTVTEPVSKYCA